MFLIIGDDYIVPNGEITIDWNYSNNEKAYVYYLLVKNQSDKVASRYKLPKDVAREVIKRASEVSLENGSLRIYLDNIIRDVRKNKRIIKEWVNKKQNNVISLYAYIFKYINFIYRV